MGVVRSDRGRNVPCCAAVYLSNFRKRVLHKLAKELELPKLTFQVIRRTIATPAQDMGALKDVQGMMRH